MDGSHVFQDKVEGEGDMQLGGVYTIPSMSKVAGGTGKCICIGDVGLMLRKETCRFRGHGLQTFQNHLSRNIQSIIEQFPAREKSKLKIMDCQKVKVSKIIIINTSTHTVWQFTGFLASLVAQMIKNLPAVQETMVQLLGLENSLEKGMTTHSSILAWRISWTEEPDGLQSTGSQRVGHN